MDRLKPPPRFQAVSYWLHVEPALRTSKANCLTGKSHAPRANLQIKVQPFLEKYFASAVGQITPTSSPVPSLGGAARDRHGRGAGRGGRGSVGAQRGRRAVLRARERFHSVQTNGADPPSLKLRRDWYQARRAAFSKGGRGRRNRVVLTPRRWRQVLRRHIEPNRASVRYIPKATVAKKPGRRGEHEISR
jgi:hypothetical protein